jgi:hypothetical protein
MTRYISEDQLPLTLTVRDISNITGLSLGKAYELCHFKHFPKIIIGKRIIIPKQAFLKFWNDPLNSN